MPTNRWGATNTPRMAYAASSAPAPSHASRVGTFDILTVLPSGTFAFLVCYIVLASDSSLGADPSIWQRLQPLVGELKDNPAILLAVMFVSYFFGSILRALPSEWADASPLVGGRRFPCGTRAEDLVSTMVKRTATPSILTSNTPALPPDAAKERLNYLKDKLRAGSPQSFAYYQTFEARSGFVATMLWAGMAGLVGSIIWLAADGITEAGWQLAFSSLLLTLVFGIWLPKVRRQEASTLVTLAISEGSKRPQLLRSRRRTERAMAEAH